MAVVAIVGIMAAIAMATMSRAGSAQNAASLARSLQFAMMSARTATLSDGFMRRLDCTLASTGTLCTVERADVAGMSPTNWPPLGGAQESRISAGSRATIWNVSATCDDKASNAGSAPVTGARLLYFRPDGTVGNTQSAIAGATFYVSDNAGTPTGNQYKVYVYPVTGMPRLVSNW